MKAVFYERQGPADEVLRVGEVETPSPGAGEVLVRLRATGVNPSDVKRRSGLRGLTMGFPRITPHSDGAGVIEAVGSGVPSGRVGERVWLWNAQYQRSMGTAAEYIALPAEQAVTLPETVDFDVGACAGIPLMTAAHAVNIARLTPGMTVFVSGGAGAVSQYIIQLAARRGANVLASCSNDEKAALAYRAGARAVVNYRTESIADFVAEQTGGKGAARLFEVDLSANSLLIPQILSPHGEVIAYGLGEETLPLPGMWMLRNSARLTFFLAYTFSPEERRAAIDVIQDALRDTTMIHTTVRYDGLESTAQAHRDVERSMIGNAVVVVA